MKIGDMVQVIEGEFKGRSGEIIGAYQAEGVGFDASELKNRWWVTIDEGETVIIKKEFLKLIT